LLNNEDTCPPPLLSKNVCEALSASVSVLLFNHFN